jgi:hypothetical protein
MRASWRSDGLASDNATLQARGSQGSMCGGIVVLCRLAIRPDLTWWQQSGLRKIILEKWVFRQQQTIKINKIN